MVLAAITATCGLFLGFWLRDIRDRLISLALKLDQLKWPKKEAQAKPDDKVAFAEPIDPLVWAAMEQEEAIRKLNE